MTTDIRLPITSCGKTKAPWISMATQWWVHQPALPGGGGAAAQAALRAYNKRKKESFQYLVQHTACMSTKILLADVPYFQEGATTFDFVVSSVVVPYDASETMDLDVEWHLLEIMTDIGTSENTIKDILVKL